MLKFRVLNFPKHLIYAVVALVLAVTDASAENSGKFEVFAGPGTTWIDSASGQRLNFGGGVAWRPLLENQSWLRGIGLEFEIDHTPRHDYENRRSIATGDVVYHFTVGRTEPFVFVGFGGSWQGLQCGSVCGTPQAIWVQTAGVGVKVALRGHWWLRPEFRGFKSDRDFGSGNNYLGRASVALSYHW